MQRIQGRRQRGLTLVELMVGAVLGMLLAAALMRLFADASANGQNLQRASTQIENGRYATELLSDDLRLAGYFGETYLAGAAYASPDPCASAAGAMSASPLTLPTPVRGYAASEALGCLSSRRAATDALAVRRVDTVTTTAAALTAANAQYYLQTSTCASDPGSTPLVFGIDRSAFTLRGRDCSTVRPLRAHVSRTYFVAGCNRCGSGGDTVPTLKRMDLLNGVLTETALVEGVETMRFEYGFDTDGDGAVDSWRTAAAASGAAALWENVVALKLHLIVRSVEKVSDPGLAGAQTFTLGGIGDVSTASDGYTRRAYSTVIRLVNVSSVREVQ